MYEKIEKDKKFKVYLFSEEVKKIKEVCDDHLVLQIMDRIEGELNAFRVNRVILVILGTLFGLIYVVTGIEMFLPLLAATIFAVVGLLKTKSYRQLTESEISYINNTLIEYPVKTENVELHSSKKGLFIVVDNEIHQIFFKPDNDALKVITVLQLVEKEREKKGRIYFIENVKLYGSDIQQKDD